MDTLNPRSFNVHKLGSTTARETPVYALLLFYRNTGDSCKELPANTELGDQVQVALAVTLSDVAKQTAALTDELQKSAASREILLVDLQVLSQFFDACSIDCDLDTGAAGVFGVYLRAFNSG